MNNILVCLTGLPGSGKTTFANLMKKRIQIDYTIRHICFDDFLDDFTFDFSSNKWKECRSKVLEKISDILKSPVDNELSTVIIADDNFYFRIEASFMTVSFRVPLELCLKNNGLRPQPVPSSIIVKMNDKFEWPDPDRRLWERYLYQIDDFNAIDFEYFMKILNESLDNPLSNINSVPCDQSGCDSIKKIIDNELRNLVHILMENNSSIWKKKYGKLVSQCKLESFNSLKSECSLLEGFVLDEIHEYCKLNLEAVLQSKMNMSPDESKKLLTYSTENKKINF